MRKRAIKNGSVFSASGIGLDIHKLEEEEVILPGMIHLSHLCLFDIVACFMDVGA